MKTIRLLSIISLLFVGLNALAGGYLLMTDPSGSSLGMSINQIYPSIFDDFLIPGILLFVFNGVGSVLTAFFVISEWKNYSGLVIVQGMILFVWIIAELFFFDQIYILQYLFAGIGLFLFAMGIRLKQMIS